MALIERGVHKLWRPTQSVGESTLRVTPLYPRGSLRKAINFEAALARPRERFPPFRCLQRRRVDCNEFEYDGWVARLCWDLAYFHKDSKWPIFAQLEPGKRRVDFFLRSLIRPALAVEAFFAGKTRW